MKLFNILIIIFCIHLYSVTKEEYTRITWGKQTNLIGVKVYEDGSGWGPDTFEINNKGHLILPDVIRGDIQIFNKDGKLIKLIENTNQWPRMIYDIVTDNNGDIIFYASDGNFIKVSFISSTIMFKKEKIKHTGRIKLDDENNIYASRQCFSPNGKTLNFNERKSNPKIKRLLDEGNEIEIHEKVENRRKKKLSLKQPKKVLFEINDNSGQDFYFQLLDTLPLSDDVKSKLRNSGSSPLGTVKSGGTVWYWPTSGYKGMLMFYMNPIGQVTDYVYEDYSQYLRMILKIGKDGNLYAYTPHEKDGVIIWKYTFDE